MNLRGWNTQEAPTSEGGRYKDQNGMAKAMRLHRLAAEEPVEEVDDEEGDEGAGGVEERIPGGGGAGGDEGLVDFVEGGIGCGDEPGGPGPGPTPTDLGEADAAEEDQVEDEVFGEVSGLADEVVDDVELRFGDVGKQSVQDGVEDGAGVVGGEGVGGEGENEAGPEDGRPPGAEPVRGEGFAWEAVADLVEIGCGARIAPRFGSGQRRLLVRYLFNDTWKRCVVSAQSLDGVHKKVKKRFNAEFTEEERREDKRKAFA
jgi:hypothetical protein